MSGVYQLLTTGAVPPSHQDHPASRRQPGGWGAAAWAPSAAGLQLASAAVVAWGREPEATNSTTLFHGCLDYVLMSHHWEVADALPLPPGAMGADPLPPLPSAEHPSDHIPLAFKLRLLPEKSSC